MRHFARRVISPRRVILVLDSALLCLRRASCAWARVQFDFSLSHDIGICVYCRICLLCGAFSGSYAAAILALAAPGDNET